MLRMIKKTSPTYLKKGNRLLEKKKERHDIILRVYWIKTFKDIYRIF